MEKASKEANNLIAVLKDEKADADSRTQTVEQAKEVADAKRVEAERVASNEAEARKTAEEYAEEMKAAKELAEDLAA